MAQKSNKEIEQYYFEMFRRVYPLPNGRIEYGDKPDVIIDGSRKIGIEITRFFIEDGSLSESEQNQRRVRKAVIRSAQEIYIAEKSKPIEISFGFNKDNPIRNKGNLITEVVKLGKRIEMAETGEISRSLFDRIPELSFVYVNATVYSDPKWQIIQTYTGPMMSKEKLAQIVREKEDDTKGYHKCNGYWLLVVVDSIDRAQDQEIRVEGIEEIKSELFEKIIVYKTLFNHILEINKDGTASFNL